MKKGILSLFSLGVAWAATVDFPTQIDIHMVHTPQVAPSLEGDSLFYELVLTNYHSQSEELKGLTFLDPYGGTLARWDAPTLKAASLMVGRPQEHSLVLAPGASLVVYCNIPYSPETSRVRHRFEVASGKTLEDSGYKVSAAEIPVLGTPFGQDGNWLAINAPTNDSIHRRTLMTLKGDMHISQRFAVDWVLCKDQRNYFGGDGKKRSDHYCYGVPVVAVEDGSIVDLQDGLAEGEPSQSERAYDITPRTIGGNWVALEMGAHRYAMYAHLQPGSLRVSKGQRVRKGEVLGLIGNSGNSTAPHLHLHVSDRPNWVEAEGIPYAFQFFRQLGVVNADEDGSHVRFTPYPRGEFQNRLPGENSLVRFSESQSSD